MEGQKKHFYEFGPFRVDPTKRLLLRDGTPQPLTPKAFDILLVLVRQDGQVIEKDDLMRAVWPDTVVEENNLTRNISALRKALGEGPQDHSYVVTVPGRGYSFVAGVKDVADEPAALLVEKYSRTHLVVEEEEENNETGGRDDTGTRRVGETLTRKQDHFSRASRHPGVSSVIFKALVITAFAGLAVALGYYWPSGRFRRADEPRVAVGSIAVLPFKMIGADPANEYLGLGMADALITRLGNIRAVVVRPTSAVRKYTDPGQDPVAVGREQGVEAVLDGSMQRIEDRLRVTVQLVNVRSGAPLWAGKFDERFTDIFAVQDSISEQVARALMPELTGAEHARLTKRHTENTEAYQLYLKGRYFWNKRNVEGFKKAIDYFQQAIDKDPNYALAYAGLADCYGVLTNYHVLAPNESIPKARVAALKALEIDETLAEAHCMLAGIKHEHEWDFPGAERLFKQAIMLNPNYATAHQWYAEFLTTMGRHPEAIAEIRKAQELDPLSLIINVMVGATYHFARQYDESIEQSLKTIEMDSNFYYAHAFLGKAYAQKGMHEQAVAELQKATDLSEDDFLVVAWLGHAYAEAGKKGEALTVLKKLEGLSKRRYVSPADVALVYAGLGDKDQAFVWLEKAYEKRDPFTVKHLKVDPVFDSLHSDPRFRDLLRRTGLEP